MGQPIMRNGKTWQCDELPVDFPLGEEAMRGLVLHEPRPHALLVQPVEQEEIVACKGLFDEVSAIAYNHAAGCRVHCCQGLESRTFSMAGSSRLR